MKWIRILKRLILIKYAVILALLSVWYNNFFGAESEALIPYTQYLQKLALFTAGNHGSNGKSIGRDGKPTGTKQGLLFGASQEQMHHRLFQLIHQGTKLIPADFRFCKSFVWRHRSS
jgi:glucose-6-phosphate isomerase